MKERKLVCALIAGALIAIDAVAAAAAEQPLHVLYLGGVEAGGRGGGFGSRTNYVYLPGQTLAPEAIYFDHRSDFTHITESFLKHYDAVVQTAPDSEIAPQQAKLFDSFKTSGKALIQYTDDVRPSD